jgi:tagatose 1,6-diphosphate aldolase
LLLAYEHSGYDNTKPGRLPDLLPHVSVKRIVDWDADAVKILIYYSPFDDGSVNDIKHAFVERIGSECEDHQIPFFLEFVGYDPKGGNEKGVEYAKIKPDVVYKGEKAQSMAEAMDLFRKAAAVATKPFIYLSAGVGNAQFVESLRMATEAGTDYSGVLCGRATWKDGMPIYATKGLAALEDFLSTKGVENINAVNAALTGATPWYKKLGVAATA